MSLMDGLLTSWSPTGGAAHDVHQLSGLTLTWSHGANSRVALAAALASNKLVVCGDISLAEMSRYPVPIMAPPVASKRTGVTKTATAQQLPLHHQPRDAETQDDLTLDCWLQEVTKTGQQQKAIKLTFTSTRAVEPAFRVLTRHTERLRGPLILAANIMGHGGCSDREDDPTTTAGGAPSTSQPVDAWTFLMLCRARFPRSIISIGWCQPHGTGSEVALQKSASPSRVRLQPVPSRRESFDSLQILAASAAAADPIFELDILADHYRHRATPNPVPKILNTMVHSDAIIEKQLSSVKIPEVATSESSGCSSGSPSPTSQVVVSVNRLSSSHLATAPPTTPNPTGSISPEKKKREQQHQHEAKSSFLVLAAAAAAAAATSCAPSIGKSQTLNSATSAHTTTLASSPSTGGYHQLINQLQQQHQPLNLNISDCVAEARVKMNKVDEAPTGSDLLLLKTSTSSMSSSITSTGVGRLSSQLQSGSHQHPDNMLLSRRLMGFYDETPLLLSSSKLLDSQQNTFTQHINKKVAILSNNSHIQAHHPPGIAVGNKLMPKHQQQQQQMVAATTNLVDQNYEGQNVYYTREMIDKMASVVKEYNLTQPITFPVFAKFILRQRNSLTELQRLLYQMGSNSTLTIVAQQDDLIKVDDLLIICKAFAANQLLFDLPDDLASAFKRVLENPGTVN